MDKDVILSQVIDMLPILYPDIGDSLNEGMVSLLFDIAYEIAKNDGLEDSKIVAGIALLILDMLLPTSYEGNVASKTIDGVSISYATHKYSISKWRTLYERLVSGMYDTDYTLHYVGING